MDDLVLLGDEAVALGALHAGLSAAYGYPGTPSTEIMEYLIAARSPKAAHRAAWCANEKTAYEEALGASFAGRRALVTMKHVGLNVAADPFVNSALVAIKGGLVLAVADDPGMHSSQDEQDSRFYADFAMIPCLEPTGQQEAYEMTREAFDLSERFQVPVMIRITTRLAHSRAGVSVGAPRAVNPLGKSEDKAAWTLLPANARKRFERLCAIQADMEAWSTSSRWNGSSDPAPATPASGGPGFAVITGGLGRNYYEENLADLEAASGKDALPARLHIGAYPLPAAKIRALAAAHKRILVIEEGAPLIEKAVKGILSSGVEVSGKLDGKLPRTGELNPDNVRAALGLAPRPTAAKELPRLPSRPPQLCAGCPHADSYNAVAKAVEGLPSTIITADIGCYALGALPPFAVPEALVCMGASISMAVGAAEAGYEHSIGFIGDSTFLHSGITPLIDAVSRNVAVTIVILDNSIVAMTGGQETILPSARLEEIVKGVGVDPAHVLVVDATRAAAERNVEAFRREIAHRGVSVVIARRECLEAIKAKKKKGGQPTEAASASAASRQAPASCQEEDE
jgi:indolepyruvate ferredoxin oxidoreductase, alpha subunit